MTNSGGSTRPPLFVICHRSFVIGHFEIDAGPEARRLRSERGVSKIPVQPFCLCRACQTEPARLRIADFGLRDESSGYGLIQPASAIDGVASKRDGVTIDCVGYDPDDRVD